MTVQLKVKRLRPEAILPTKAHATDAAWDIYSTNDVNDIKTVCVSPTYMLYEISTGIAFDIPAGYFLKIETRSSLARNGAFVVGGIIDSGYVGEVRVFLLVPASGYLRESERIAQAILHKLPDAELVEVDELPQTERGTNGFGSTGK